MPVSPVTPNNMQPGNSIVFSSLPLFEKTSSAFHFLNEGTSTALQNFAIN